MLRGLCFFYYTTDLGIIFEIFLSGGLLIGSSWLFLKEVVRHAGEAG